MLLTLENPNTSVSDTYRRIRMNIEFAGLDQKIKVLNITSTSAEEAKTTTSCNLAVMFANKFERVLLIDADLRKPSVHRFFQIKNINGLSELTIEFSNRGSILEHVNLDKYVQTINHENIAYKLDVITAGSKIRNPIEFLGSNTFKVLIEELKERYDMIIVDSAPCGIIVDGVVVSTTADATLFVIEHNKNSVDAVRKAVESLKNAEAKVIGTVLTKAPVKAGFFNRYQKDYARYGYGKGDR